MTDKPMTLGEFRKYTENLPDDMPIHLNDPNFTYPICIIGIHQKILMENRDGTGEEILSIILDSPWIEVEE